MSAYFIENNLMLRKSMVGDQVFDLTQKVTCMAHIEQWETSLYIKLHEWIHFYTQQKCLLYHVNNMRELFTNTMHRYSTLYTHVHNCSMNVTHCCGI